MAGLVSLTQALINGPDEKLAKAYLIPLDQDGVQDITRKFTFQFYPESVSVSVSVNYAAKDIPGLSHPLQQWTSTGGRTISYDALFSRDIRPQEDLGLVGAVVNPQDPDNVPWNMDPRYGVARLQSFVFPTYSEIDGVQVATPPPVLFMVLEGMDLGTGGDPVYALLTSVNVEYQRLFPNGVPRRVRVSLEFVEVIQIGDRINSWDASYFDYAIDTFKSV